MNYKSYFQNLTKLINEEWQAEKKLHFETLAKLTLQERRKRGFAWYPLEIIENGFALGQKPYLLLERKKGLNISHQFKSGSRVEISLSEVQEKDYKITGTINWVRRDRMRILFNQDRLPDWIFKSSLVANVFFDERVFEVMTKTLNFAESAPTESRLNYLSKVLIGETEPYFLKQQSNYFNAQLNDSQNIAINKLLEAQDYFVIHGPPGTGKTTTLVAAIEHLSNFESPILICAASNTAVDHLVIKLAEKNLNVVRIGNLSRMNEEVYELTIDSVLENHKDAKSIKKMKQDVAALRKQARKFKRSFGFEEARQRRQLFDEAKQLASQIKIAEIHLLETVLDNAQIIATTLVGVDNTFLKNKKFETVIIDEAAQALEPACFIAIAKAKRVIMAGDPFQLPPTIKSNKKQLAQTLMEKLLTKNKAVQLLNTQYRMNEKIMQFSSNYFYDGKLLADKSVAFQNLVYNNSSKNIEIEFIDTAGCGFEEMQNPANKSFFNEEEYNLIGIHLTALIKNIEVEKYSIAIITPYKEQVKYIENNIENHFNAAQIKLIDVNSVDAFQGQERDIIYISLVRSNSKNNIGFLKDYRRMNVALTRARKKLVVIGDSSTIGKDDFYSKFLDYVNQIDAYKSAFEYLY